MSEIRIDVKTSGDAEPIKKIVSAQEQLNKAIEDGLALPIDRELSAQEDALNDLANAAAEAGESVEKFAEQQKRVTGTSIKDAFDPAAGLTGLPDFSKVGPKEFQFSTIEEVAATEKAVAALTRKIAVTGAAGKSTTELAMMLDVLNESLQTESARALMAARSEQQLADKQTADRLKEQAEAVKEVAKQKRDWRSVIQGLSAEVPGLGQVFRAFTSTTAMVGFAAGAAIQNLREFWAEFSRPGPSAAQWKGMEEAVAKVQATMNRAAVDAATYAGTLQAIATAEDSIATSTEKSISKLKEEIRARLEIQSAEAALKTAKVDAAEKAGKITPEAAIRARAQIAAEMEAKKVKAANEAQNAEINQKDTALKKSDQRAPELKRAREAAEAEARLVNERETVNKTRIDNAENNIKAERAKRAALQKQLSEVQSEFKIVTPPVATTIDLLSPVAFGGQIVAKQTRRENQLAREIQASKEFEAQQQAILDSAQKTAVERAIEQKAKNDAAAKAKAAETENAKAAEKLRGELPELVTKASIEQQARATVLDLNQKTRAVKTQSEIEQSQRKEAEEAAKKEEEEKKRALRDIQKTSRRHGGGDLDPTREEASQAGNTLGKAVATEVFGSNADLMEVVKVAIATFKNGDAGTQRQVAALRRELDMLRSQVSTRRV